MERESILEGNAPMTAPHVREMRVAIRELKNTVSRMSTNSSTGRYHAMVNTSLEKAAMWLGRVLGVLGEAYPYKEDEGREIADDTLSILQFPDGTKPVEMLHAIREKLRVLVQQVRQWSLYSGHQLAPEQNHQLLVANIATIIHLDEARMDLGMVVGNLLREGKNPQTPAESYPPLQDSNKSL